MNYRLAFVFSYERFENALICIISRGPSTFLFFRKGEASLELLNIVFDNSLPKGFFGGEIKKYKFFDLAPGSR